MSERCECPFSPVCNPASQAVARILKLESEDCILVDAHRSGDNPTSRGSDAPF